MSVASTCVNLWLRSSLGPDVSTSVFTALTMGERGKGRGGSEGNGWEGGRRKEGGGRREEGGVRRGEGGGRGEVRECCNS